jgi:hypothetical protein
MDGYERRHPGIDGSLDSVDNALLQSGIVKPRSLASINDGLGYGIYPDINDAVDGFQEALQPQGIAFVKAQPGHTYPETRRDDVDDFKVGLIVSLRHRFSIFGFVYIML